MTTSGSTNFSLNRDEIIQQSLVLLGVYGQGDTISQNDYDFCAKNLNMMVKAWEAQGVHLWTYQEGAIFLSEGQEVYSINSGASDIAGDDVIFTTLSADASGTSITVESNANMNIADNIGIKLDDNTIQWTTISSLSSTDTVNLNASLTGDASENNNVFVFTNRIDRPLEITSARYKYANGTERPIKKLGRDKFMKIPNKDAIGPSNQFYYSPKVSSALFYTWPTCDDVGDCIKISYIRRIQDFDSSSDTPDMPQEWYEPIVYNLCIRNAPSYGISTQKLNPDISIIAATSLEEMKLWDAEEGSIIVCPSYDYYN